MRLDANEESHACLYGALQQLTEQVSGLAETQKKTDETVNRLGTTVSGVHRVDEGGNGSKGSVAKLGRGRTRP